ncbi:MAG: valine--tRNA ligase, partial [Clostridia bacterium]|nr:valine--tRNA ligase [Clostridia bacterium]
MNTFEMAKVYAPKEMEERIYKMWEESGAFKPKMIKGKKPFTIVMPPPNITGQLHVGHALDEMPQDVLIRYHRMKGDPTLWVPGTDHAAIATEVKVVDALKKEGLTKQDLGREKFLDRVWDWRKEYGGRIVQQLRKLGVSCDWSRERFTMDEGLSKAVRETFVNLYEKDLIYQGWRMINWCPCCKTSISDAEVEYEEQGGNFWHILYPVKETGEMIELATTRPETMLGDTAVAINAEDERYKHLHGCHVILPIINREIPIVCDEHADMTKGTGVVKITPAHDPNDYEVGKRHNLPMVRVFTYDGHMTGAAEAKENADLIASGRATKDEPVVLDCGKFAGMTTAEARKAIVAEMTELGCLKKVEPLTHEVGTCYRCHQTIEPMVSKQWFVKMEPLAKPAVQVVKDGKLRFIPDRFEKVYLNWMENTRDWCISRQLWWGHRIPVWYCDDCGEATLCIDGEPKCCEHCHSEKIHQDPDTLDTWFSSALWPFSTMGWPEETPEYNYFYPTNVLVTGYDIITFWVSRMIFSALAYTGKKPFTDVVIHGLVRDALGRKMSKSLGNGIDPLEIIDTYGADALRLALVTGISAGNDTRFTDEKVTSCRNFANKLWNAARFVLMNLPEDFNETELPEELALEDKWLLSQYNELVKAATENIENYDIGVAEQKIVDFIWDTYCSWYIELAKARLQGESADSARRVLVYVLTGVLKLLHPFMPFITEEIWQALPHEGDSIMVAKWPEYTEEYCFTEEAADFTKVMDAIKAIRNRRAEMNVPPSKKAKLFIETDSAEVFEQGAPFLIKLASASEVDINVEFDKAGAVQVITDAAKIYIPMAEL